MSPGRAAACLALGLASLAPACTKSSAPGTLPAPEPVEDSAAPTTEDEEPGQSLGNLMVGVARRFEIAGRAAEANRFELAEFEVGEIEEIFEGDVPHAELPKEGPTAQIPAMAKAFLATNAPELKKAAAAKDRKAFADAFQHAAAACNGCHQASAKGFIQVPSVPGKSVPDLEPIPLEAGVAPTKR